MVDIDEENLGTHASRLGDQGAAILAVPADVTDAESVESVGRAVVERFGKLHVAVNNAGVVTGATPGRSPSRSGTA